MRRPFAFLLFLSGTLPVFGQLDSNSVTVTPSQTLTSVPDQLTYALTACGPIASTLDDAVSKLQGLGITAAAFSSVNSQSAVLPSSFLLGSAQLCWTFSYTAAISKSKDTVTALTGLVSSIPKSDPNWTFTFSINGTQSSSSAQPACSLPDLMTDARARAQQLADAAGMTVAPVLAVSGYAGSNRICSMVVKFGLTRQ